MLQVKSKPLTLYLINFVPRSENIYSDAKIYYNYIEFAIVESITFKIFFNDTGWYLMSAHKKTGQVPAWSFQKGV